MPAPVERPFAVRSLWNNAGSNSFEEFTFRTSTELDAFHVGLLAAAKMLPENERKQMFHRKDDGTWHSTVATADTSFDISECSP